jgi:hypothetical protein
MEITSRREAFLIEKCLMPRTGEGEMNLFSEVAVLRGVRDES